MIKVRNVITNFTNLWKYIFSFDTTTWKNEDEISERIEMILADLGRYLENAKEHDGRQAIFNEGSEELGDSLHAPHFDAGEASHVLRRLLYVPAWKTGFHCLFIRHLSPHCVFLISRRWMAPWFMSLLPSASSLGVSIWQLHNVEADLTFYSVFTAPCSFNSHVVKCH